jgi:hypothetical protein
VKEAAEEVARILLEGVDQQAEHLRKRASSSGS